MLRRAARLLLAVFMVFMGVAHFVVPEPFVRIVPAMLPAPAFLVYFTGVWEIAGGLGLLWPSTRQLAVWALIALYVVVFPANVNMAVQNIQFPGRELPNWMLWARLPWQIGLIAWAWWVG